MSKYENIMKTKYSVNGEVLTYLNFSTLCQI